MKPSNLRQIEKMTDAAIKGAGWLSGKLKKQILEFRKKNKSQIKDLTDPKKAAAQKPRFTPREPEWKYSKSAKDAMAGKTKPKHKIIDLKTLTPKDKAAAALAVPAIGGGGGAALTLKGRKKKIKKKAGGGKVGMSHQGLYPAEEARSGTMSEMERVKHMKKGKQVEGVKFKDLGKNKVKMKLPKRATLPIPTRKSLPHLSPTDSDHYTEIKDLIKNMAKGNFNSGGPSFLRRSKKKSRGGQISEEQGHKDRKDESISMRVKKKRTKKQLVASSNESYGKWGSKAKKRGKINRSSSKGWDGNTEVSRHYDS